QSGGQQKPRQEYELRLAHKCTSEEQSQRAATSVDWFLCYGRLAAALGKQGEHDFRILGGDYFAFWDLAWCAPPPLPVNPSRCACPCVSLFPWIESYGVTAEVVGHGQTQATAAMREAARKEKQLLSR
ncbi:Hypothetical predicted protein, partial [Olea europaea subsp. europaea]